MSTAMKATDSGGSYETGIGLKDKARDMEKPETPKSEIEEAIVPFLKNKKCRGRHGHKNYKEPGVRKAMQFVQTVQEGIFVDVKQGQRKGERTPPEYWARVWDEIHRSRRGPPDNMPNKTLRDKWKKIAETDSSPEAIWEHMEREYPGPFLVVPLIHRWHSLGKGKPVEFITMFGGLESYNEIMFAVEDENELKEKLDKMKEDGKEEEFWKQHWDDIHGVERMKAICDHEEKKMPWGKKGNARDMEKWCFPSRRMDSSGKEVREVAGYQKMYPIGYKLYSRFRRPADERAIYKEFDFCS